MKELGMKGNKDIHDVYSGDSFRVKRRKISKMLNPHEALFLIIE
jgi:hypothetical protein